MILRVQLSVLLLAAAACGQFFSLPTPWVWRCVQKKGKDSACVREPITMNTEGTSRLSTCQLTCGQYGTLWPYPRSVTLGKTVSIFFPQSISHKIIAQPDNEIMILKGIEIFRDNLDKYHPDYVEGKTLWRSEPTRTPHKLVLQLNITGPVHPYLTLDTADEAYTLNVSTIEKVTTAAITAKSYFGIRHGLETLSQLIDYEEQEESLQVVSSAVISDEPVYPYRGILLDTSRNFFSVASIKRTIDGMAANKLNTFHWHITDSHSFPMVLNSLPNMAYFGAYSPRKLYRPEDVREVVEYGRLRGVRVMPEFDAPAHVGHGWEWGPQHGLGDLAVCVAQEPWQKYCVEPPCGQLNIANENIYLVLGKIYEEMAKNFGPFDLFHFGGDEVNINCWNSTTQIAEWMIKNNFGVRAKSYFEQWSVFQEKAYNLLTKAVGGEPIPGIMWTSSLTQKNRTDVYLNKDKYIIQIWSSGTDPLIKELLDKNFRVIFSNHDAWYMDCGFGAWVGEGNNWCSPYKGWQTVYDNSPREISRNLTGGAYNPALILGGEVCMWAEQVDDTSLDSRIWPRAAALAERLWNEPSTKWDAAEYRIIHHRQRLVSRGIGADRLQPEWCHQNEGYCYVDNEIKHELFPEE